MFYFSSKLRSSDLSIVWKLVFNFLNKNLFIVFYNYSNRYFPKILYQMAFNFFVFHLNKHQFSPWTLEFQIFGSAVCGLKSDIRLLMRSLWKSILNQILILYFLKYNGEIPISWRSNENGTRIDIEFILTQLQSLQWGIFLEFYHKMTRSNQNKLLGVNF